MFVRTAEANGTKKCFSDIAATSETFATFPVAILPLLGLQPASLHRLLSVVLWFVVTRVLNAFRLRDTTNSLGISLHYSA